MFGDIRVRHTESGKIGTMGPELALTGPAMGVHMIRWDDGTSEFRKGNDSRIEVMETP